MNRSPRLRQVGRLALVAGLAIVLAACASNAPQDALDPAGPGARTADDLFRPVFFVAVAVFVIVEAMIVVAIVRGRRRPGDDELPEQVHGNTRLEIGWTILPALVLGVVAVFTVPVIFEQHEEPEGAMQVTVTGQKYWWGYEYEPQGEFGIETAFETANELHIPAGVPVFLELHSRDVIHSFWAPRLHGKRDVTPGRIHTWTVEADEPGVYSGQCAEFCGTSHANMRLKVVAHDPAGWDAWVSQMQESVSAPTSGLAAEGFELFETRGCASCHNVAGQYEEVSPDSPASPDLTKLFTRDCFAGCIYDLNDRNEVRAWLRDPQRKAGSLMVIPELSEDDIDRLYAYLRTLE